MCRAAFSSSFLLFRKASTCTTTFLFFLPELCLYFLCCASIRPLLHAKKLLLQLKFTKETKLAGSACSPEGCTQLCRRAGVLLLRLRRTGAAVCGPGSQSPPMQPRRRQWMCQQRRCQRRGLRAARTRVTRAAQPTAGRRATELPKCSNSAHRPPSFSLWQHSLICNAGGH